MNTQLSNQSPILGWFYSIQHGAIALVHALIRDHEPIVRCRKSTTGIVWTVYDPEQQLSHTFTSEDEVRCWLEQRYS